MGGGWWSCSYIWEKLRYELDYSFQIATTRLYDIDVVERDKHMHRENEIIIHARQSIFWMRQQKVRILVEDVDTGPDKD